tara:strand:+ start:186 stop:785 length:600 start_codon:yes stop_codon:yes gene_type:complete
MAGDKIQFFVGHDNSEFGVINYTVNHTRTSWGLDLEGHIKSHIESLMDEPSIWDKVLFRLSGPLNILTTLLVGLYIVNWILDLFFKFLLATNDNASREQAIETAANYLLSGQIAKYIVASLVVAVVFFVAFSGLVSRLTRSLRRPRPSFICLSEFDGRRKLTRLKKYNKKWVNFSFTIAMDIIVAVLLISLEERIAALF